MAVDDNEPTLADLIEKGQHRGAAPPAAYGLLSAVLPGAYFVAEDWDGDLGDLSEDGESGETADG